MHRDNCSSAPKQAKVNHVLCHLVLNCTNHSSFPLHRSLDTFHHEARTCCRPQCQRLAKASTTTTTTTTSASASERQMQEAHFIINAPGDQVTHP